MVVYACNPTTWKAEAGGLPGAQVYCQPVVNFRPSKGFVWYVTKNPAYELEKLFSGKINVKPHSLIFGASLTIFFLLIFS